MGWLHTQIHGELILEELHEKGIFTIGGMIELSKKHKTDQIAGQKVLYHDDNGYLWNGLPFEFAVSHFFEQGLLIADFGEIKENRLIHAEVWGLWREGEIRDKIEEDKDFREHVNSKVPESWDEWSWEDRYLYLIFRIPLKLTAKGKIMLHRDLSKERYYGKILYNHIKILQGVDL